MKLPKIGAPQRGRVLSTEPGTASSDFDKAVVGEEVVETERWKPCPLALLSVVTIPSFFKYASSLRLGQCGKIPPAKHGGGLKTLALYLFLTLDGRLYVINGFKVNEFARVVALGKPVRNFLAMLVKPSHEVVRNADIENRIRLGGQ